MSRRLDGVEAERAFDAASPIPGPEADAPVGGGFHPDLAGVLPARPSRGSVGRSSDHGSIIVAAATAAVVMASADTEYRSGMPETTNATILSRSRSIARLRGS